MEKKESFWRAIFAIALPVALQCMLQSSFCIIDQLMIGQLGGTSITAIGFASKFSSIFTVVVSAVGTVAGIFISQYFGANKMESAMKSFVVNTLISLGIALVFVVLGSLCSSQVMSLYTKDNIVIAEASNYLRMISVTFITIGLCTIFSVLLRTAELAFVSLIGSIVAVLSNTGLNYVLIFGKFGAPKMGIEGAAVATVVSSILNCLIITIGLLIYLRGKYKMIFGKIRLEEGKRAYLVVLFPILINEFLWSLGENIYSIIYGHMGTKSATAITLSYPIQGLFIGALSGFAGAATVIVGKKLGNSNKEAAYSDSKKLLGISLVGALILSGVLVVLAGFYIDLYNVAPEIKTMGRYVLYAFAAVAPLKVLNMVLSGGIIRSGGNTKIVMWIDLIGTWIFGIPLGLLTAFVFGLPIWWVYFILSLEEGVRVIIGLVVFVRKKWMINITEKAS